MAKPLGTVIPKGDKWFTCEELAEQVGVHIETIRRAIARNELWAVRLPGVAGYRVAESWWRTYLASRLVGNAS